MEDLIKSGEIVFELKSEDHGFSNKFGDWIEGSNIFLVVKNKQGEELQVSKPVFIVH